MNWDADTILKDVYAVVEKHMPSAARQQLELRTNLFDLGLDSMRTIRLIVALETTFGCHFEAEDVDVGRIDSIENIARLVSAKLIDGRAETRA